VAQFNQEVEAKKMALLDEFHKKLAQVVQVIAEQEHCLIVFREEGMGTDDFVLYHAPALDLTGEVIQAFAKEKPEK
jgi:Skp family chaperone for outer membrane proteins